MTKMLWLYLFFVVTALGFAIYSENKCESLGGVSISGNCLKNIDTIDIWSAP